MNMGPQIIPVGQEPPPLHSINDAATPLRCPEEKKNPKEKRARRATADRFAVLNTFVDCTIASLNRSEIVVWMILYRDTKRDGTARTGQADIARRAGITDRSVRRVIKKLQQKGLTEIVHQGGFRRGASVYQIRPVPSVE